jgi:hypothetical protein
MKKLLIAALTLTSISAMAGTYNCDVVVSKNGAEVGKLKIEKEFGMIGGRLATVQISEKKNIFGKKVEEVEVVFNGLLQSGDGSADSEIDGSISVIKSSYRGNRITNLTVELAKVKGSGAVEISGSGGDGFSVEGGCEYR